MRLQKNGETALVGGAAAHFLRLSLEKCHVARRRESNELQRVDPEEVTMPFFYLWEDSTDDVLLFLFSD